jgi:AraC-like DNA-binding protein
MAKTNKNAAKSPPRRRGAATAPKPIRRLTLHERTRQLIVNRPRPVTLETIADRANVSEAWLRSIIDGKVDDPSVNMIQRVYEFLTGEELQY